MSLKIQTLYIFAELYPFFDTILAKLYSSALWPTGSHGDAFIKTLLIMYRSTFHVKKTLAQNILVL